MADTILQFLQWAIPSGGIGAAIAWIVNRRVRTAENKKKVEDTYKQMYDMVSTELIELQKKSNDNYDKMEQLRLEHDKTRRALNRLSRAIEAIQLCPHRAACPVSRELQVETDGNDTKHTHTKRLAPSRKQLPNKQPASKRGNNRDATGSCRHNDDEPTDDEPP